MFIRCYKVIGQAPNSENILKCVNPTPPTAGQHIIDKRRGYDVIVIDPNDPQNMGKVKTLISMGYTKIYTNSNTIL